jgi:fumarate hydratase subunit alpha
MREVHVSTISQQVAILCGKAATELPDDVEQALRLAKTRESSELAKFVLDQLITNVEISRSEKLPLCQDTGYTVVYADIGQDVHVVGGNFNDAIHEGVRQGYKQNYLRASVIDMPFGGTNTGDNTPAIIHSEITPGEQIHLTVVPKGMGCENTSRLKMVKPSEGWEGVIDFIVETVRQAGPNACPPLIVGVGIGGTFDYCAYLAKKAILLKVGTRSDFPEVAEIEEKIEQRIFEMKIGPQGLGGETTALGVHLIVKPCHIASVPVAVNIQCHSARQKSAVI